MHQVFFAINTYNNQILTSSPFVQNFLTRKFDMEIFNVKYLQNTVRVYWPEHTTCLCTTLTQATDS